MHQTKPESHYKHRVQGRYKAEGCRNFCILSNTVTGEKKESIKKEDFGLEDDIIECQCISPDSKLAE